MREAIDCHRAGKLIEAERGYRAILSARPGHADANHNLGVLFVATGRLAAGLPYFQAALQVNPAQPQYWLSCIDCLVQTGQADVAREVLALGVQCGLCGDVVEALRKRLVIGPNAEEVGSLRTLFIGGRYEEGVIAARRLTERFPDDGIAWKLLGGMLSGQHRLDESLEATRRAATLLPGDAETQRNLACLQEGLGRHEQAEVCYRRALVLQPDHPETWNGIAILLQTLGRANEAESHCRRALELRPGYADAGTNLGIILEGQGRFEEAEATYRSALEINPERAETWSNLGSTLQKVGRLGDAEVVHRLAIELNSRLAEVHSNLGSCLYVQGRFAEAAASFRTALDLDPGLTEAWSNLGSALLGLGQIDDALAAHRTAVDLDSAHVKCHSALLFCLSHSGESTPDSLFAAHRRFGDSFEAPLRSSWRPHSNVRDPERILQIGLVSADFCQHAMMPFLEPLVAGLAGDSALALHVYAGNALEDAVTGRLKAHIPRWRGVVGISDAMLAETIRADAIDVLIDLSGHTNGSRMLAFARKPAPIQCGWIGYLGSSGMYCMDYYLTDRYMLPRVEFDSSFTEAIVHLPAVACFQPYDSAPPVNLLPALSGGELTFGSFCRPGKLNPTVVALWSRLLRALPHARMLVGAMLRDGGQERVAGWFTDEGIGSERLRFHQKEGMDGYLKLHHEVDICLDAFPYTGGATTGHALWMGVPTLTLAGRTAPGRLGIAMLQHVGLNGFVAHDEDDFVEKALGWARNLEALAELRGSLRGRLRSSSLGQPATVAEGMSQAFRAMWRRWCDGLPPEPF